MAAEMSYPQSFNAREASMIRAALRERAEWYRRLARSRKFAGPVHAPIREGAREEAAAYDALAADPRCKS